MKGCTFDFMLQYCNTTNYYIVRINDVENEEDIYENDCTFVSLCTEVNTSNLKYQNFEEFVSKYSNECLIVDYIET